MRLTFAALVLIGLAAPAVAQTAVALPQTTQPLPRIGLPLPRIGLPLPPIASSAPWLPATPAVAAPPVSGSTSGRAGHGRDGRRGRGHHRGSKPTPRAIYVVPAYGWPYPPYAADATASPEVSETAIPPARSAAPTGTLRLDVTTDPQAQVFVDGLFTGTLSELPPDLELTEGPHRVELRGTRHQPLTIDVQIVAGRTITYRGALTPLATAAAAPPLATAAAPSTPLAPVTVYMIPGCYLGNVPPKDAGLPASCDLSRVTTFQP